MCTICQATTTFDPTRHVNSDGTTNPALVSPTEGAGSIADIYDVQLGGTGGTGGGATGGGVQAPSGTLDQLANYLTNGYWTDNGESPRAFDTSVSNVITVNITALTPEGQQLARWAMDSWEMVADIEFVEVTGSADITFDDNQSGAFAGSTYNPATGEIISSTVNVSLSWLNAYGTGIDSYSFSTYVHEIGHALGLGHQGNYNGAATYGVDETFANDSYQLSIMSYFSQNDNWTVNASYGEPITAQMADIIAIQNLYGAPDAGSVTAGNTTWGGRNANVTGYLNDFFDAVAGGTGNGNYGGDPVVFTIYDQGGIDTIDLTWSTLGDRVDLRGATFSDVGGMIGNMGIARGTVIENLEAGSGNDTITGNGAGNRIWGNDGNDTINGMQGFDRLFAGNGNDRVNGGNGRDRSFLGNGNDTYTDTAQGGWLGQDTVYAGAGNDTVATGGGNDLIFGLNGADSLNGGWGDDTMNGGNQADVLIGNNGNDSVNGGNGADTANLGNGNDTYTDTAQGGANGADTVNGGNGNDNIHAGGGNDTINGGNGNDSLTGGYGNDNINGGNGVDRIWAGHGNDTVTGGLGRDQVWLGFDDDRFIDNTQTGALGNDVVFGGDGNDTIEVGGGNDTLTGDAGADEFVFNTDVNEADVITDFEVGIDTLTIDAALWGGSPMTAEDLISTYGAVTADGVLLDFGNGNSILLEGLTTTTGLADSFAETGFVL